MNDTLLTASSSPHIRDNKSTASIMLDVLIALFPSLVAGVIFFGFRALLTVAVTTATAVVTEWICRIVMKRSQTAYDLSAAVTGMILGLILPPECNLLVAVFGAVVSIVVVKQMFGGIGQNFANPACVGRIVLLLSFSCMTEWRNTVFCDAVTSATPLSEIGSYSYLDLFLGNTPGCIGETCAVAIIIGFVYLVIRRVIFAPTPVIFVGFAALTALVCGEDVLYHVLSGGLLFGAVFMATDYTTTPFMPVGKMIFAAFCGIFTVLIRVYGNMPEGVSYAILLMNILSPLIDRIVGYRRPFGVFKEAKK